MASVYEFNGLAIAARVVNLGHIVGRHHFDYGSNTDARAEAVLQVLDYVEGQCGGHANLYHHFVRASRAVLYHHHVVDHVRRVVQDVVYGRRIDSGALEFDHIVLAADDGGKAIGIAATPTLSCDLAAHVSSAKAQQRHALHAQGGHHHLAYLPVGHGQVVFSYYLHDDKLGMDMTTAPVGALGEGGAHLGGGICGIEFHIPLLVDAPPQEVEAEVLFPQSLAYAYDAAYAGMTIVYAVLFGVLYQAEYERGNAHDGVGTQTGDGVPLQFGHAVANTYYARAQGTYAKKIGQARHETLVQRGHQLHYVAWTDACTCKRLLLVVGQTIQVTIGATKGDGVAQRAGGGDVVYYLLCRHAEEVTVVELQVLLLGKWQPGQVVNGPDGGNIYTVLTEHALIVWRMSLQVGQGLLQTFVLILADVLRRAKLYVFHVLCHIYNKV